ncbi:MAG: homoserine dehydrogenase [Rhodobacterales bacterium]|nr:MAG: homoserine dehydrogenase [Rhodobacterales bacterium]
MTQPLRLGIAGLGTVGVGVIRMLRENPELITARAGREITVSAVSARSKGKDRGVDLTDIGWEDDPVALARRDDVDVFVELMGGHEGAAKDAIEAAIAAGKDVVTANKALLAIHGQALAISAEAQGVALRYEAAVAGGIPCVKALTEGLAGNRITRVMGVMNGTCNYILTRMEATGQGYNVLFDECAELGYLEADPTLDVGGIDAGHKLAILSSIAFGTQVDFGNVTLEGIQHVTLDDIRAAADMGYRIKLLGVAQLTGRGLEQRMTPCLVPANSPLGQLEGGTNMVVLEGDAVGQIVMRGAGAGEGPTASAVMGDVIDVARGLRIPVFGQPATGLRAARPAVGAVAAPYYLRLRLTDKPGALAKVAAVLGDCGISIHRMRQYDHEAGAAPVLIVTHKTTRSAVEDAAALFESTGVVETPPVAIRIEEV